MSDETQELDASDLIEAHDMALLLQPNTAPIPFRPSSAPPPPSVTVKTDDRSSRYVSSGTLRAAHAEAGGSESSNDPVVSACANGKAHATPHYEEDAYFHPGGRILSIADGTIEGWRAEPTMVLRRVRSARNRSWIALGAVAIVLPLTFVLAIAFGRSLSDSDSSSSSPDSATPPRREARAASADRASFVSTSGDARLLEKKPALTTRRRR